MHESSVISDSILTTTPGGHHPPEGGRLYIYRPFTMSAVFRFTVADRCSSGSNMLKNLKYTAERVNKITRLLRSGVKEEVAPKAE